MERGSKQESNQEIKKQKQKKRDRKHETLLFLSVCSANSIE